MRQAAPSRVLHLPENAAFNANTTAGSRMGLQDDLLGRREPVASLCLADNRNMCARVELHTGNRQSEGLGSRTKHTIVVDESTSLRSSRKRGSTFAK